MLKISVVELEEMIRKNLVAKGYRLKGKSVCLDFEIDDDGSAEFKGVKVDAEYNPEF